MPLKNPSKSSQSVHAELHSHSTFSDGDFAPDVLAQRVAHAGVSVWSLTDHDTSEGCSVARKCAENLGIEFIDGIEISAFFGQSIHVLGYGFNPDSDAIREYSNRRLEMRRERMLRMVQTLNELGVDITFAQVEEEAAGADALTRPHLAKALVSRGTVSTVQEAFDTYLGDGKPAFAETPWPPVPEAIEVIHQAGGIAVLAHPGQYSHVVTASVFADWVGAGLDGVECHHPRHDKIDVRRYIEWADQAGILKTASSDYHGPDHRSQMELGEVEMPGDWMDAFLEAVRTK